MNIYVRIGIVALLAVVVGIVVLSKQRDRASPATMANPESGPADAAAREPLPTLIELGAGKCAACKAMVPILERLEEDYAGRFNVQSIDVIEDKWAADAFRVRVIPVQVFTDAQGNELFRHEGFYAREDILAKWKELGYSFDDDAETPVGG